MPIRFLSDEWVAEVKERLNRSDAFRAGAADTTATLQQVIASPEGERRYWIRVADGTIDMGSGGVEQADATITQDYETAAALARGELNPVAAFMSGKLRINGSMTLLLQLQGALAELPRVMSEMDVEY
jgi:putative sterol carrier protein